MISDEEDCELDEKAEVLQGHVLNRLGQVASECVELLADGLQRVRIKRWTGMH